MADLILHHYAMSPFSEKVCKVFAVKRIAWRGVEQPMWNSGPGDPSGALPGDRVTVTPDGYASDPVGGEIVALSASDVAIRRRDPEVGEVVVHFPRAGFRLASA